MLSMKKLEKGLIKVVREEIDADGFAAITKVVITPMVDGREITVVGTYGQYAGDGNSNNWAEPFEITYADGRSLEFVRGLFFGYIQRDF
jgi:hypothetical protein